MKDRQYSVKNSNEESNKITKSSLQTALIYLMNKKDFDKITITELVKKAGVSRMAFYRNYNSKEDILEKLKVEFINILKVLFINLKIFLLSNVFSYSFFIATLPILPININTS